MAAKKATKKQNASRKKRGAFLDNTIVTRYRDAKGRYISREKAIETGYLKPTTQRVAIYRDAETNRIISKKAGKRRNVTERVKTPKAYVEKPSVKGRKRSTKTDLFYENEYWNSAKSNFAKSVKKGESVYFVRGGKTYEIKGQNLLNAGVLLGEIDSLVSKRVSGGKSKSTGYFFVKSASLAGRTVYDLDNIAPLDESDAPEDWDKGLQGDIDDLFNDYLN